MRIPELSGGGAGWVFHFPFCRFSSVARGHLVLKFTFPAFCLGRVFCCLRVSRRSGRSGRGSRKRRRAEESVFSGRKGERGGITWNVTWSVTGSGKGGRKKSVCRGGAGRSLRRGTVPDFLRFGAAGPGSRRVRSARRIRCPSRDRVRGNGGRRTGRRTRRDNASFAWRGEAR